MKKEIKYADNFNVLWKLVASYYEDVGRHNKPHIHVRYQGNKSSISIKDGTFLAVDFPPKQSRMVLAWIEIHRDEIMADWEWVVAFL